MARVLVVGGINQDVTVRVDHRPGDGETVLGAGPTWGTGGKGANMAVAAARTGADVMMCGAVGDDAAGTSQLEKLRRARVDVSLVRIDPDDPTGVALIVVTPEGESTIVVGPGANLRLQDVDIEAAFVRGADVVIAQAEVGGVATDKVAVAARRVSCRLVLSLAPVTPWIGRRSETPTPSWSTRRRPETSLSWSASHRRRIPRYWPDRSWSRPVAGPWC